MHSALAYISYSMLFLLGLICMTKGVCKWNKTRRRHWKCFWASEIIAKASKS